MAAPTKKKIEKLIKDIKDLPNEAYGTGKVFEASLANKLKDYFKNVPDGAYGTGKVSEAQKKKVAKFNRKIDKVTAPVRKKIKKVTAPVRKKIKDFSNQKSKEYKKSAQDNAKRIFGGSPFETKKQSIPSQIADGLLFFPKNMRNSAMQGINKKINTKEERKAAGLNYKKGGMVKKCRMDGIALRGKTRAKERSK
jgi:hypothetical protein